MTAVLPQSPGRSGPLMGSTTPRVATTRPIGPTRGRQVARFARDRLNLELLPWQEWALEQGMVHDGRRWSSRTVAILVGRQNGKTTLVTVRALAGMELWGEDVIGAAQNRDVARDSWATALALAEEADLPVREVCRTNGRESFRIGKARYKIVAANSRGARGLSAPLVILDELREYRDWTGYAALEKTRRAQPSSQLWAISNEGDEGSVVLDSMAEQGRSAAESKVPGDLAWFEWSAAPDASRSDPAAWAASNPALGRLILPEVVASEALHDDPEVFETEVLCRRVATLRPWLAAGSWDGCADPAATVPDGAEVALALTSGDELRHATIAVGWRRPDGRYYVEAIRAFDDPPVLGHAAEYLVALVERWHPPAVCVVARSSAEAAALRALEGSDTRVDSVSSADLVRAANAFHEGVVARTVVHPGDPLTGAHVGAITADGVLRPRSSHADVDAAVAIVLARHGVATAAPAPVAQDWTAF
jgi:hypothetical protein